MKKLCLSLLSLVAGFKASAQFTLTNTFNAPVVGDTRLEVYYDSTTNVPKITGPSSVWNFTSMTLGTYTENVTYTTVASTPYSSVFPSANLATLIGTNTIEYVNSQLNSFDQVGMIDISNSASMVVTNPLTMYKWPMSMSSTYTDNCSQIHISPTFTNNYNGSTTVTATGSGTVILPNGNTHSNCLQLKSNMKLISSGTDNFTTTATVYNYYSSCCKFPIFSIAYSKYKYGPGPNDFINSFSAYTNSLSINVGVSENSYKAGGYTVSPNPANDFISINGLTSEDFRTELINTNGQTIIVSSNNKNINVNDLNNGIYFLRITSGDSIIYKRIIIQH